MKRRAVLLAACTAALFALPRAAFTAHRPVVLYLHDYGDTNQVWGYQMTPAGALTPVSGSPFNANNPGQECGGECQTIGSVPGRNLLVASGANGMSVFRIGTDGALTLVPGSPFGNGIMDGLGVVKKAVHTFVYASQYADDAVMGFALNADDTLIPLAGFPVSVGADAGPDGMAAFKDVVVVATENHGGVASFKVQNNGSLVAGPGSPVDLATSFNYNVNIDSTGHYVYTADGIAGRVFGLKLNHANAALTPLPRSPFPAGGASALNEGMAVGKSNLLFAFTGANGGPNIQVYKKSGNGQLTALGSEQSISIGSIDAGALDPTGKVLALAADSPNGVATCGVNPKTGALTFLQARSEAFGNVNGMLFVQP